jgi:hypothetical protein
VLVKLQRLWWTVVAAISPRSWLLRIVRRKARSLLAELEGVVTDKFVELLLVAMDVGFLLLPSYRRNLRGFAGGYLLRTADQRVAASAVFTPGRMFVHTTAIASPTVTVTFKDPAAFRRFLFSKDQDILQSLLANEVEVDGNLNYVYKLGFMARDLLLRLGLA